MLNDAKTAWAPWGEALDPEESLSHLLDESEAFDAFDLLCGAAQDGELGGVPRCLAQLPGEEDVRGLAVLRAYPWLAERLPRQTARYLKAIWSRTDEGLKDWACSLVVGSDGDGPDPLRFHLLHSLRRELAERLDSTDLFASGLTALSDRSIRPVACELIAASVLGGSKGIWSDAIDTAFELTDLNAQRAHIGELPRGNITSAQRRGVDELARRSSGLLPLALTLAV
ncbi:MAG: hypothetical protein GY745_18735 [Actinomycetia bacterium]|nr:hypothetical protein [Actinomycetes bacterium]